MQRLAPETPQRGLEIGAGPCRNLQAPAIQAHQLIRHRETDTVARLALVAAALAALTLSAETGDGVDALGPFLFDALRVVRVYTKSPGKPADTDKPFTVRRGDTVLDVARLVHREIADGLRFARMWGRNVLDGQQTGPDHPVADGDVVELHL